MTAVRAGRIVRGRSTAAAGPARQLEPDGAGPSTGGAGSHWLILAAEMAGLVTDSRGSSPYPAWPARERSLRMAACALSGQARSVRAARDFTVAALRRWRTAYSSQDITIVVSELVTNALRHALPEPGAPGPPGQVRLGLLECWPWLLCAVADPSTAVPVPRPSGTLAETGRGLQMICALSDQWGYTMPGDAGKIVWATFTARHAARSRARFRSRPGYPELDHLGLGRRSLNAACPGFRA